MRNDERGKTRIQICRSVLSHAARKAGVALTVVGVLFSGVTAVLAVDRACTMPDHSLTLVEDACERIEKIAK